ncbi:MAG TPA: hypothetical protein VJZ76_14900 [Thermoanaerobaculia bacterium]|nr:hypothetical protein [Thermoanaerobaculia bacterium]
MLLFFAASLQAQPIVFSAPQSLPMTGFAQPPAPGALWLTGSGDGFFALYGTTMIRLDAGGRTVTRESAPATDVAAVVAVGSDVLVAGRTSYVVDPLELTTRTLPIVVSTSAAVASNGSTIVAVEKSTLTTVWDRRGAVVSTPKPLFIPSPDGKGAIATNGRDYLAVWNDGVIVRTVLLDPNGVARWDSNLRALDVPALPANAPLVAAGGGKYLVVWQDGKKLYARFAGGDGRGQGDAIVLASDSSRASAVVWDGQAFAVAFGGRVARLGLDGTLLDPPPANNAEPPIETIASNGRAVVAVRRETCACAPCNNLRIGPLGGIANIPFGAPEIANNAIYWSAIAATEEAAVVAYRGNDPQLRVRIAFLPSRGPSITVPSSNGIQSLPAIATDGKTFLVVWNDRNPSCKRQVRAAVMDAEGRFGPTVFLSNEDEVDGSAPAVAWNGSEYAVAWMHASKRQLGGIRVSRSGVPLSAPTNVTALMPSDVFDFSIAWMGGGWVIGFRQEYTYLIARVGPDLRPLAPETVLGSAQYGNVAWNGSEAVAFFRFDGDLKMVHVDAQGNAVSMKSIALPMYDEPWIAWRNGEWLVTGTHSNGTRLAHIKPDGEVAGITEVFAGVEPWIARVAATPSHVYVASEMWNKPWTILVSESVTPRVRATR